MNVVLTLFIFLASAIIRTTGCSCLEIKFLVNDDPKLALDILKEKRDKLKEYIENKSTGEIAVFSMVRFKNYFVKIFQQWRGEKMLANDRSTWVANDAELIEAIKSLSSLNIKFEEGKK